MGRVAAETAAKDADWSSPRRESRLSVGMAMIVMGCLVFHSGSECAEETMSDKQKQARRLCSNCGAPIPAARLAAIPGVTTCIECAKKNPPKVDINALDLSQASPIDRTGFAPSD